MKNQLQDIRRSWGKSRTQANPKNTTSFSLIAAYSAVNRQPFWHELNDQTRSDIDFEDLFCFTDHTNSRVGQQYLYDSLLKPQNDEAALQQLDQQAQYFTNNANQREKLQTILKKLDHPDAYYIQLLLEEKLFTRPGWYPLAIADTLIVIGLLLAAPFYPALLIWVMLPFAINIVLHLRNKNYTYRFIKSFSQLYKLTTVARKLQNEDIPFDKTNIEESLKQLKGFRRKSKYLSFGQTGNNEIAMLYYWFLELIKALFLVELHVFFRLIKELEQRQSDIQKIFQFTGQIDLALSVASLRNSETPTCKPKLTATHFHAKDLAHPLINDCVVNTLDIHEKGVLITGSNMSGKTTFLRTIGINAILAQTLYTCCAAEYTAPPVRVFSSIRIDDSLLDGKSYYFEEVNIMGELIEAAKKTGTNLYLLDEVFKGTNMIERISAAKAILSWLNSHHHIVVVSTHDLELSDMLKEKYDLYHFEETLSEGQLIFDHLLKKGPLKTRNAIRILGLAGYPDEILRDAEATSRSLTPPQD